MWHHGPIDKLAAPCATPQPPHKETHMTVWGFCSTQAFGPKVVTGHGPCRERVLLQGEGI